MKKPQFDGYAKSYDSLHRQSITASGEEPTYFAEYKIRHMADSLGERAKSERLSILDFGCGIGNSLPHLTHIFPNARLFGADVSSESLQLAKQSNPQVALAHLQEGRIPMPDQSMDIAFAACVYHHIPPSERAAWTKEIKRILKPDGNFFIFEHNPLNPLTQRAVKSCEFDNDAILLPSRESLSLLSEAGMQTVSLDYIVFFPRLLSSMRPLEKYLQWLPLGAQYVAHART